MARKTKAPEEWDPPIPVYDPYGSGRGHVSCVTPDRELWDGIVVGSGIGGLAAIAIARSNVLTLPYSRSRSDLLIY